MADTQPITQSYPSAKQRVTFRKYLVSCSLHSSLATKPQEQKQPLDKKRHQALAERARVGLKNSQRGARGLGPGPSKNRWRWADSNRRPNNVPASFLHAYPAFDCRGASAGRRANTPLSSKSFRIDRSMDASRNLFCLRPGLRTELPKKSGGTLVGPTLSGGLR